MRVIERSCDDTRYERALFIRVDARGLTRIYQQDINNISSMRRDGARVAISSAQH